jgi:Raf kinase inhibitor-like YbhB/YbcL family protein
MLAVGQTFKEGLIVLEADGLDAWGVVGGPFSPSAKAFTIRNEGTSDASWTAAKTADWISLSSSGGTIAPGGSETVSVTLTGVTEMEAGSRTGTVTFYRTLEKGSELVATRTTNLTVATLENEGTLAVTPSEGLASTGYSGGPFMPVGKTFMLRNVGKTDLEWTVTRTAGWITVAPAGGTLEQGESAVVSMGINSAAASLAAGSYADTVAITNTTNGKGNTTRPAALSIATGPGVLSVSPAGALTFSGPRGGPFIPAAGVTCTLSNTGGAPLDWVIHFQESWIEVSPFQGTLAPGASVQVTIRIGDMARALLAGAHGNTLYLMNKTNRMGNKTLDSQLTVAGTPAAGPLSVLPATGITVSGSKGGPFTPATVDFTLRNTGNQPMDWEYVGDASWIDVPDPAKGQLAAGSDKTFSVALNDTAKLLSPNNYRGGLYFNDKTNKMIVGRFMDMKVKAVGDITGDGAVDLADVVTSVQVKAGQATPHVRSDYVAAGADVNGDDRVGHQETVYTMQAVAGVRQTPAPYFILKSGAFRDERPIPVKYMTHGLSPALSWSHAPTGTRSFVLIVEDPDEIPSLGTIRNYWIVYDIPASISVLDEGAGAKPGDDGKNQLPAGAKHGTTSWEKDNTYYHGLEPTSRTGPHRFVFRLYALSVASLNPSGGTTQDRIEAAMNDKILGICELAGTLSRP